MNYRVTTSNGSFEVSNTPIVVLSGDVSIEFYVEDSELFSRVRTVRSDLCPRLVSDLSNFRDEPWVRQVILNGLDSLCTYGDSDGNSTVFAAISWDGTVASEGSIQVVEFGEDLGPYCERVVSETLFSYAVIDSED